MTAAIQRTETIPPSMWEGSLALANALDRMCEGSTYIDGARFLAGLNDAGLDGKKILAGLVATGLVGESRLKDDTGQELHVVGLTQAGRIAILHATCCL